VLLYFSVGGSIPVIFSYFTEFLPKHRRGAMISALATFWMMGNIIAAGGSFMSWDGMLAMKNIWSFFIK